MISQLPLKRQVLHILNISFSFPWNTAFCIFKSVSQPKLCLYLCQDSTFYSSRPRGLGSDPFQLNHLQGTRDSILPVCAEISRLDLCIGTWLNSPLLRATAAPQSILSSMQELGSNRRCYSPKCCNPPSCPGFSEATIGEMYTEKYFAVSCEVKK